MAALGGGGANNNKKIMIGTSWCGFSKKSKEVLAGMPHLGVEILDCDLSGDSKCEGIKGFPTFLSCPSSWDGQDVAVCNVAPGYKEADALAAFFQQPLPAGGGGARAVM